ncbi:deSI-like protein At4g17486 isoform X2 [Sorghum bicolor]|nr:deSI-like protein At4g17486 isoform X2 [Sorghum bicolor]|eukprot:XP_002465054.2 deSI-like protein At4g17486 isoform X2 [Sorghum bicolor]
MIPGSKKERNLSMRFQSGQKSSGKFCLFSKVQSASPPPGNTLVYLNVYDLTPVNGYVYWAGLGVFHSGIEVHGVEYAFGAHDYSISGVFEVEPRQCPGFKFRRSICMGTTCLDPLQIREFMEIQSVNYNGDTYHLISKNCNHFCEDICKRLTGNLIPKWVNRLARMGAVCNCILPVPLKISAARHDPGCQAEDSERKMLTGSFSCFSSISLCQRHFSTSSLSLRSPTKGTSWDAKQSNSTRLKKS